MFLLKLYLKKRAYRSNYSQTPARPIHKNFCSKVLPWALYSTFANSSFGSFFRLGLGGSLFVVLVTGPLLPQLLYLIRLSSLFFFTGLVDHFTFFRKPDHLPLAAYHFAHENYLWSFSAVVLPHKSRFVASGDATFPSLGWLERESSELTGFSFFNKSDTRNLLLEYGSLQTPLVPSFPSIGFFELSFCFVLLVFLQSSPSIQL